MYFSNSFIASALLGLGAATTHMGEMAGGMAMSETVGITASETLAMSTGAAAATSAPSAGGGEVPTHVIQVGGPNGSLTFYPENVKANVGDLVQFQFHPKNHSVVQSTFDNPCVPIQNVMPNMTNAFFSGFMPTNAPFTATSQVLTYTIRVMDEKPVWFYCSQGMHCQAGMVGAINAAESGNKTMSAFKALAATASENLSPGQAPGSGNSGAGTGTSTGGNTESSGAGGAGGAGAGAGADATGTGAPAEQAGNFAASVSPRGSLFGLVAGGLVAGLLL